MAKTGQRRFLTNRSLMGEIHRSKKTFCSFVEESHADYDIIVESVDTIKKSIVIQNGMLARLDRLNRIREIEGNDPLTLNDIKPQEVVFRVMTDEHIPEYDPDDPVTRRKRRTTKTRVNFPPFKHYMLSEFKASKNYKKFSKVEMHEVCRSHWIGSPSNGNFSMTHGKLTRALSDMFMLLVRKYATARNWKGYSYVDEMESQALTQLIMFGLQFDESKSSIPFGYYSILMKNSFRRVLHIEKKNQMIRDEIMMGMGYQPSFAKQSEEEGIVQDDPE